MADSLFFLLVFNAVASPVHQSTTHFNPSQCPNFFSFNRSHTFVFVVMAWQLAFDSNGEPQSQDRIPSTHFSPQPNGYSWSIETGAQSLHYAYHPTTAPLATSPGMTALSLSSSHSCPPPQPPSLSNLMVDIEANVAVQNQAAATNIAVLGAHQPFAPPLPGQYASASRRSKYSSLDWDTHRETIRRLYMDEEKPLKETMEIMAEQHGFHASLVNIRSGSGAGLCIFAD